MMAQHLFGNLSNSPIFKVEDTSSSNFEYVRIGFKFNLMVYDMADVNRERLYGTKSDAEIMDAIMEKHSQPLTNRSLSLIVGELRSIGMSHDDLGMSRYVDALTLKDCENGIDYTLPSWDELERRWSMQLDRRADVQLLATFHNGNIEELKINPGLSKFVNHTTNILVKLGAKLGADGLFLPSKLEWKINFDEMLSDDPIDVLLEDLERHDKSLRESRERYEKNRELSEVSKESSEGTRGQEEN